MPDAPVDRMVFWEAFAVWDGVASYQLDGGVTATVASTGSRPERRPATLGLRYGPDSYGRQQWGILHNGRKPDAATPREGWRPSGCKPLLSGSKRE